MPPRARRRSSPGCSRSGTTFMAWVPSIPSGESSGVPIRAACRLVCHEPFADGPADPASPSADDLCLPGPCPRAGGPVHGSALVAGDGSRVRRQRRHAQLSITLYALGYGLSQLVWGPLADHHGRRPVPSGVPPSSASPAWHWRERPPTEPSWRCGCCREWPPAAAPACRGPPAGRGSGRALARAMGVAGDQLCPAVACLAASP